jgi:hypothetical protein
MATLYNAQTRQPESLPEDQIESAIVSGTHGYSVNDKVNVRKKDGSTVSLPGSELNDALASGEYSLELPTQTAVREYVDENKGIGGALKVATAQFADEFAGGIPEIIKERTGDHLENAKWQGLKKQHELVNNLSGVGGFGASFFVPGAPLARLGGVSAKVATKSVGLAEKVIASKLLAKGAEAGANSAAKEIAKKIARTSATMGVEGATFAAPTAITEAALGDPELAAETLLINGLAGSVLGAGGKAAKEIFSLGKKASSGVLPKFLPSGKPVVEGVEGAVKGATDDLSGAAAENAQESILERLTKRKSNAKEIEAAYSDLGLEALEGSVSASKFIQDLDSGLSKKVSPAGIARQEKWQKVFDTTDGALKETLENSAPFSAVETGDVIRKTLSDQVKKRYEPFQKMYDDIRQMSDTISIADDARLKFNDELFSLADNNKGFSREIQDFADRVIAEDKASGIDSVIRSLKDEVSEAYRSGKFNKYQVLKQAQEKAEDFLEKQIVNQAKRIELEGMPEARALAKEFLAQKATANKEYSGFKNFMEVLGDVSKVRSKGPKGFMDALADDVALSSEKLVNKLFDKKNSRALEWLKKESPEAFDTLIGFKKNELLQSVVRDNRVQVGQLLSKLDDKNLSLDIKKLLFTPEQLKKLNSVETVYRSLPRDVNPSGTARAIELNDLLSPTQLVYGGFKDKAAEAILKASANKNSGLLYTEQSMAKVAKKLDELPGRLEDMLKGRKLKEVARSTSIGAMQRLLDDEDRRMTRLEAYDKLKEQLSEIDANAALPMERSSQISSVLSDTGAPETASQLTLKNGLIAKYLSDHMPRAQKLNTPFKQVKWTPSDAELSRFERRVNAIQNPVSIIDELVTGTLSTEAVDAVKTVYPKLFENIQGRVMQYFMDNPQTVSHNNRIKLSLLLDMPLDDDLKPENIRSFQKSFLEMDEAAASEQGTGTKPFKVPEMQTNVQSVAMS